MADRYNISTFHWQRNPHVILSESGVSLQTARESLDRWEKAYREQTVFLNCEVLRRDNSVSLVQKGKILLEAFLEVNK